VRATCVELTNAYGLGDPRHLTPIQTFAGPLLWPVDRATMSLAWSGHGYPSAAAYRDYHALTERDHRLWRNDGRPYVAQSARALTRDHAQDFIAHVNARVADGGVCVCAMDTEFLGHWWYEGVHWLEHVIDEAQRQGLRLTALDQAADLVDPAPAPPDLGVTSWGDGGDLRTWSAPAVADLAWRQRAAELELLRRGGRPSPRALRELIALQASDWAFLISRDLAGDYPRERIRGHSEAFEQAFNADELGPALRNLAPMLAPWSD
jgi:1,4-alpha-glucan branching enzyme